MDLAAFRRANDRQFDRAREDIRRIHREYFKLLVEDIVLNTPGEGNQRPEETQYRPTGRLRGGYVINSEAIKRTSRYKGGPYSLTGSETMVRLNAQIDTMEIAGFHHLENTVSYADIIVRGEGWHSRVGPRNWPMDTLGAQTTLFHRAVALARRS